MKIKSTSTVLGVLAGIVLTCGALTPARAVAAAPAPPVVSAPATRAAFLEKTRFLGHAGVAFFAFHHFVYARYQQGGFSSGTSGRVGNIAKAAVALLVSYHELKSARDIANKSKSPTLHLLAAPLNLVTGQANQVYQDMHGGHYNPNDIRGLNNSYNNFHNVASSGGYAIRDIPATVPGAA